MQAAGDGCLGSPPPAPQNTMGAEACVLAGPAIPALGFYRGLQQHRRSGRTCPATWQRWDGIRVFGSNAASMFDLPWLLPTLTSHVDHQPHRYSKGLWL